MALFYPDYQIAPGWNNYGGLQSIESITPPDDRPFPYPAGFFRFNPGELKTRSDGTFYFAGFPVTEWVFSYLSKRQVRYTQERYCNGGYSGMVTIKTRTDDPDFYQIYNAVMLLPKPSDAQRRGRVWVDYVIRFTRLTAIGAAFDDSFSLAYES